MTLLTEYSSIQDLPSQIPVFPLTGALLLPRAQLPLNIFEPRYLRMFSDALSGERLIGMVQPNKEKELIDEADMPSVYQTGCAGRITSYTE
ncbi:MAG: LON peptidase substrate-binding domain-containing protein, partial [Hyphomicrobiales bacterium]